MDKIICLAILLLAGCSSREQTRAVNTYLFIETDSVQHATTVVYSTVVYRQIPRTSRAPATIDTVYYIWWPGKLVDSTGKAIKDHKGQDSITHSWIQIRGGSVIRDMGLPIERREP